MCIAKELGPSMARALGTSASLSSATNVSPHRNNGDAHPRAALLDQRSTDIRKLIEES
jgi:hypothetical protein